MVWAKLKDRTVLLPLLGAAVAFSLAVIVFWAAGLPDPVRLLAQDGGAIGEPVAPLPGGIAPDFTALATSGDTITLADLRGGPVILNFWATWCVPCAVELPELQALYAAQGDTGLRILAVNVDEPASVFRPWALARGLTVDLLPDPERRLQTLYQVRGTPQTVLIDSVGVIRQVFYGPVVLARLREALDELP